MVLDHSKRNRTSTLQMCELIGGKQRNSNVVGPTIVAPINQGLNGQTGGGATNIAFPGEVWRRRATEVPGARSVAGG